MQLEFPRPGDKVFRDGIACCMSISNDEQLSLRLIADGYREASDLLVDQIRESGRNDSLLYPILFGYRQYLELRVKELTFILNRRQTDKPTFKKIHDLRELWNTIRPQLMEYVSGEELVALSAVSAVIEEFHQLDSRSVVFRYTSLDSQTYLDLRNVRDVMARIAYYLESLSDLLSAENEACGI